MIGDPVYLPNGTCIGFIQEGVFNKAVMGSIHKLRRRPGPGWAIDQGVLDDLVGQADEIRIVDMETDVEYVADLDFFRRMARPIDFGYGKQQCLNLRYWKTVQLSAPDEALKELI